MGDDFGASVAISGDGKTIVVGAPSARLCVSSSCSGGELFVFNEPASGWAGTVAAPAALTNAFSGGNDDNFGSSVGISPDGTTIAGGDVDFDPAGAVFVYASSGAAWTSQNHPVAVLQDPTGGLNDGFGASVAVANNAIVAGAPNAPAFDNFGAAFVFQRSGPSWSSAAPHQTLEATQGQEDDVLGTSVAISADGHTVVAGAPGVDAIGSTPPGAVYVFTAPSGTWRQAAVLTASDATPAANLGQSVAIDGDAIVAGAPNASVGGHILQGEAYMFAMPAAGWSDGTETQKLIATAGSAADDLGQAVGIADATAFAAAPNADADAGLLYRFGSVPATTIALIPANPDGANGWYVHPVRAIVSAADLASPVTSTGCVLDPAVAPIGFRAPTPCPYAGAGAIIGGNGAHALYAASENAARYQESPSAISFRIDTTPPTVTCAPAPTFPLHGRAGLVTATVTDAQPGSGPAQSLVAASANVAAFGHKAITLVGQDNAGNSTAVQCPYVVTAPTIPARLTWTVDPSAKSTLFQALDLKHAPAGAKIAIKCKGGGCPFASHTTRVPTTRLVCNRRHKHCKHKAVPPLVVLNLEPLFGGHHLSVNDVLQFLVTKTGAIGQSWVLHIRSGRPPTQIGPTCIAPGASKPGKGC